jgi:hypothetical protein
LRLSPHLKYTVLTLSTIYAPPLQADASNAGTSLVPKSTHTTAYGVFASETYTTFVVWFVFPSISLTVSFTVKIQLFS